MFRCVKKTVLYGLLTFFLAFPGIILFNYLLFSIYIFGKIGNSLTFFLVSNLIIFGGTFFWLWILVDCSINEARDGNTKIAWVLIIIFVSWIGALLYFFVRRPERLKEARR